MMLGYQVTATLTHFTAPECLSREGRDKKLVEFLAKDVTVRGPLTH